jgi:hypothetical protein
MSKDFSMDSDDWIRPMESRDGAAPDPVQHQNRDFREYRASEQDWRAMKDLAAGPDMGGARAILELRTRIEALEAAQSSQRQGSGAASDER